MKFLTVSAEVTCASETKAGWNIYSVWYVTFVQLQWLKAKHDIWVRCSSSSRRRREQRHRLLLQPRCVCGTRENTRSRVGGWGGWVSSFPSRTTLLPSTLKGLPCTSTRSPLQVAGGGSRRRFLSETSGIPPSQRSSLEFMTIQFRRGDTSENKSQEKQQ